MNKRTICRYEPSWCGVVFYFPYIVYLISYFIIMNSKYNSQGLTKVSVRRSTAWSAGQNCHQFLVWCLQVCCTGETNKNMSLSWDYFPDFWLSETQGKIESIIKKDWSLKAATKLENSSPIQFWKVSFPRLHIFK